jgi:hypothetical protein
MTRTPLQSPYLGAIRGRDLSETTFGLSMRQYPISEDMGHIKGQHTTCMIKMRARMERQNSYSKRRDQRSKATRTHRI